MTFPDFSPVSLPSLSPSFSHHITLLSEMIWDSFQLVGIYCVWLSVTYCVFLIGLDIDKLYSSPLHKWLLIDER